MELFDQRALAALPVMGRASISLIQSRLHGTPLQRSGRIKCLPRFICIDGFSMSVQASEIHACLPKGRTGPYSHVECACPSEPSPDLMPYRLHENGVAPEEAIYRHVPFGTLLGILISHGGLRV